MRELSLNDQLRNAASIAELDTIMAKGKTYVYASDVTKRKWVRVANNKAREIV